MKRDDAKLLQAYIATSGYTIQALEHAIEDLKDSASLTSNAGFRSVYLDIIEELESYLNTITYLD